MSGTCYKIKDAGLENASVDERDAADEASADSAPVERDGGGSDSTVDDARIEQPVACPKDACDGGICVEAPEGWSCDCTAGYAGTGSKECTKVDACSNEGGTCQVDPCDPSPCGAAFTCDRTPAGAASCVESCAATELGCQLGDPCGTDEDCRSGGDANASCEPVDKVCVTVCPTTSIVSELNLEAAKYCHEIDGDLIANPNFATIPASALPYLKRIRGRFNADGVGVLNTNAHSLTFSALQTVDGGLTFTYFQNATLLSFPRLVSVGGDLTIVLVPMLERLSLPQLAAVQGKAWVAAGQRINQLDIGRLQTIGGALELSGLCNLPWSQVSHLRSLVASPTIRNIGCCTGQWSDYACDDACMCN